VGQEGVISLALSGILAFNRRWDFAPMYYFFSYIIGSLLNIVQYISHGVIVLFRNFVLLAVIFMFLYGIFRVCQIGWQKLWHLRRGSPREQSAPKDKPEDGPE
jgi:ABC-type amino acid transport system permease subunit